MVNEEQIWTFLRLDPAEGVGRKGLKGNRFRGMIPHMTVTADDRNRVVLPGAKPGDRFDLQDSGGAFVLRRLNPVPERPAKVVKPVLRKGVWVLPIEEGDLDQEALVRQIQEDRES